MIAPPIVNSALREMHHERPLFDACFALGVFAGACM